MIKYNEFWGWCIKIFSLFLPPIDFGARVRGYLYKPFLRSSGNQLLIPWRTYIFNPNRIRIGSNVYLGYNSYYGQGDLTIKDNVLIGPFVSITPSNHLKIDGDFRNGDFENKGITIESNVWIGAHVCILAGVTIGEGSIVSAGSVVTKNVPKNSIVGGVPSRVIKSQ